MSITMVSDNYGTEYAVDRKYLVVSGHKYCAHCDSHLPYDCFNRRSLSPDGLQHTCRVGEKEARGDVLRKYNAKETRAGDGTG